MVWRFSASIFWLWSIGYWTLALILGPDSRKQLSFLIKTILAFGLGIGISSVNYLAGRVLFDSPGKYLVYSETLIFVMLLQAFIYWQRPEIRIRKGLFPLKISRPSWLALVFWLAMLVTFLISMLGFLKTPQGAWDAWMIWNIKARFLFRGDEYWRNMFFPGVPHPDYPLLVSASVASVWSNLGKEARSVSFLIGLFFTIGTPALLAAGLSKIRGIQTGYLAGLTLLISPGYIKQGYSQYADIPLAFYFLVVFFFLVFFETQSKPSRRYLLLAGLFTGFCAWTKNEGWLFLVALLLIRFGLPLIQKPRSAIWKELRMFLYGLAPVLVVLIYHKFLLAPPNYLTSQGESIYLGRILDFGRYQVIIREFIRQALPLSYQNATPFAVLVIIPALFGANLNLLKQVWFRRVILIVGAIVLGYGLIYLVTPLDLEFHLNSSLNRLYLHIWPITIFLLFLFIKPLQSENPSGESRAGGR